MIRNTGCRFPCLTKMDRNPFFIKTPLLHSTKMSALAGANVWLKMENMQIAGSFKSRGLSNMAKKAVEGGCTKFVCYSGGNAGLAAAVIAKKLNKPITVVLPSATPTNVRDKLRAEGATVEVCGKVLDEAKERALELKNEPGCVLIHPYDHPDIWEGHSSIIDEIVDDGVTPDLIVLSVGGGGLMSGVLTGMHRHGWTDIPLLAMETMGAQSLNACTMSGEWEVLDNITSDAVCLAVKQVCKRAYDWLSQHPILSETVTDKEAASACMEMADDHRVLVTRACGAALAAIYSPAVLESVRSSGKLTRPLKNIVVIVCGGNGVDLKMMDEWKKKYDI